MIFSKEKSYITRELKIVYFVEKFKNQSSAFPNKFSYANSTTFNVRNNGMYNSSRPSAKDILTEIIKPTTFIEDPDVKPKHDRVYYNYEFHIDDLFNIIRCQYDKPFLSVNTFADKISKEALSNSNHPEIEFEDGRLGTIIESVRLVSIQDKLANKIKYLSKAIDIKLKGI